MARDLKEASATGNVTTTVPARLHSVVLTAGSDAASVIVKDGTGGSARLTLKAAASTSVVWMAGDPEGVLFGTAIHATLSGTGPVADFEFS
jgi:hypothetical protein